jgi:hypothetical protein
MTTVPIRIGYVPEHYLLPLHLAAKPNPDSNNKTSFPFPVQLIPFPSGTGHMITSLRAGEIDVAIGLTEGWVAGLLNPTIQRQVREAEERSGKGQGEEGGKGKFDRGYKIIGRWVNNPLRWSIVTGRRRDDVNSVKDLGALISKRRSRGASETAADGNQDSTVSEGLRVGVSRLGSGSHVMASVLAKREGWERDEAGQEDKTVQPVVLGPFKELRDAVNSPNQTADFFMWEHFTTKPYWENPKDGGKAASAAGEGKGEGEIKWIGEIYTPWPAWHVVSSTQLSHTLSSTNSPFTEDQILSGLFTGFDKGMALFHQGGEDLAIKWLGSGEAGCVYGAEDVREWMKNLEFAAQGTRGVERSVMLNVLEVLKDAGVLGGDVGIAVDGSDGVVGIEAD